MFSAPMNFLTASQQTLGEGQPLLKPMSQSSIGGLWAMFTVTILAAVWCVLDSWNHDVSGQLFGMREIVGAHVDKGGAITGDVHGFQYPLLLAFLQFGFMGLIFLALFLAVAAQPFQQLAKAKEVLFGNGKWRIGSLALTHAFSIFWLQSLMMPKQMMSLGLFAATRAVEIPAAAGLRARVFGARYGGHPLATTGLMFTAAWVLFFAYSQLANCLCVWSGFGVSLTGPALFIVYALLLTLPVANVVCQEACMVQLEIHAVLMLALMNLMAFMAFIPLLAVAHLSGWEDVLAGASMVMRYQEVAMLVLWLCVQMALTTGASTALVYMVDSFWAVALRSLRVVFWWSREIVAFYFASGGTLLSVAQPHTSFWSFMMISGLVFMLGAVVSDCEPQRLPPTAKHEKRAAAADEP